MTQPTWRDVWRALLPKLPASGLAALREALVHDDPRLIHGMTVLPCTDRDLGRRDLSVPIEGACLVADVGGLEARFAEIAQCVGVELRHLTNWWDDCAVPRDEKRAALLAELDAAGTTN
jgi:hypothetical protein